MKCPIDPATIVDQPTAFISGGIHYTPEPLWYADRLRGGVGKGGV